MNATIELAMQPAIQSRQLRIGNIADWQEGVSNALTNIGIAGALGFSLSGGGKAIDAAFFEKGRVRTETLRGWAREIEGMRFNDGRCGC